MLNTLIKNKTFSEFYTDGINISEDRTEINSCIINDTLSLRNPKLLKMAHRDAIQIIPSKYNRDQYIGGLIEDITINNNRIESNSSLLQGIFMSDGLINNLSINNNIINTNSYHKITICGLIRGNFNNNFIFNKDKNIKEICPIRLFPLRIGGNSNNDKDIWILSFRNEDMSYRIIRAETSFVIDNRFDILNKKDIYLEDFDLNAFREEIITNKINDISDINKFSYLTKKIALSYGKVCT